MTFLKVIAAAAVLAASAVSAQAANIVETAKGAGQFNTLLAAATAAGLAPTLSNGGPFTVFAPTDAAFARLPKGTVANLLKPQNKHKLAALLKYHVVSGEIKAGDIKLGRTHVRTLNGRQVSVFKHGGVSVNGAKVVAADVDASNGVIHVINRVLIPKG
jgi:uncharacterized surface protein with fasciclin (FAS1) repeats